MERIEEIDYLKRIFVVLLATLLTFAVIAPISFGLWENRESKQEELNQEEQFNLLILNQTGEIIVGQLGDEVFSLQNGESYTFALTCKQDETIYYDMQLRLIGEEGNDLNLPRFYVTADSFGLDAVDVSANDIFLAADFDIDLFYGDETAGSVLCTVTRNNNYYRDVFRTQNWEDSKWIMPFELT